MKKFIIPILTLSLSLLFSCGSDQKEVKTLVAIPVKVSGTVENMNSPFVTASGKIEAENSANVSTRMMGYVTKVHVTARFEMAKAGLEGAKQMRNEVMAQFNYANITAPFSGTVTNSFVKEGDMANPGMPLVSVEGVSKLQVTAMVSESDISNIKNGIPVNVIIKSQSKQVSGKVSEVSLSAKNTGGQYLVKVTLDKMDTTILSGMFVNVQFPIENKTTTTAKSAQVLVPETALVRQGQLTGVYTIANNTAMLRWLRIGKTYGDKVEVLSGLNADEPYVVSSEGKLFNGAKVSVQ
jgi:RND family efflux transporter MFP subunit